MSSGLQEMENAWNEYLKLESDVEQLKQALQEQHRRAFFFQVSWAFMPSFPLGLCCFPPQTFPQQEVIRTSQALTFQSCKLGAS